MKTVVITGSARGLGLEMAKCFRGKNFNVVISDLFKKDLEIARLELLKVKGIGDIDYFVCDVTRENDIVNMIPIDRILIENTGFSVGADCMMKKHKALFMMKIIRVHIMNSGQVRKIIK